MKPVEEIARLERLGKALGAARSTRDWHRMEVAYNELRDHALPAIAAALRAERETHACPIGLDDNPTICSAGTCVRCLHNRIVSLMGRAEKAEAERDEVLWDARFQIDAQVKSREAAEARAEKAEAERDEATRQRLELLDSTWMRRAQTAESALATARNRALEEAAECVKDCRQWEPECPHAARILSLRIPEAST